MVVCEGLRIPSTNLFPTCIKNIEWENNCLCQMSCNVQVISFTELILFYFSVFINGNRNSISLQCGWIQDLQYLLCQPFKSAEGSASKWVINQSLSLMNFHGGILRGISRLSLIYCCSWHQKNETTKSPILQFTNLKCCKMSFKPLKWKTKA